MLGSVLYAAHTHSRGDVSHLDCGLCVTAHMAVQAAAVLVFAAIADIASNAELLSTKLEFDLYYLKNLTLSMDLYIMFHTAKVMLLSKGSQ